jgi:pyrimidine-specific ribonucleoside hydrolase
MHGTAAQHFCRIVKYVFTLCNTPPFSVRHAPAEAARMAEEGRRLGLSEQANDTADDRARRRRRIVFDMETRDPDDALTLCLLASHPRVDLLAVTLTPGTAAQVGIVREILRRLEKRPPIGARHPGSPADAVSPFHADWLGRVAPADADAPAHALLAETLRAFPDCTLLTGAPLHNLRLLLRLHPDARLGRWVAQGGFAGDNLVEPADRLAKFAGRTRCESYNFGHDVKGTLAALSSRHIAERWLVGKNVTHGVAWDAALHQALAGQTSASPGLALAHAAMRLYLARQPAGKLLHDPLAAVAAIDPAAFTWREATVTRREGQWESLPGRGTRTFVAVAIDRRRVLATLFFPATPAEPESRA